LELLEHPPLLAQELPTKQQKGISKACIYREKRWPIVSVQTNLRDDNNNNNNNNNNNSEKKEEKGSDYL
jgi:hypothetical protein